MTRALFLAAIALGVAFAGAPQAKADGWRHHGHGHGGHWYGHYGYGYGYPGYGYPGPGFVIGFPGVYWGAPWPPYAAGYYGYYGPGPYAIAPATVQAPPVYVERQAPRSPAPSYWYYCPDKGYYPDVPSCRVPWVKVPPRPD
jgi:hypothetical protein